jgi:hypothetical protein
MRGSLEELFEECIKTPYQKRQRKRESLIENPPAVEWKMFDH